MKMYGKSCERCRVYFVALESSQTVCPWCQRVLDGQAQNELYEGIENA